MKLHAVWGRYTASIKLAENGNFEWRLNGTVNRRTTLSGGFTKTLAAAKMMCLREARADNPLHVAKLIKFEW